MYTIPGAVNIAARNTFVALDNIKLLLLPQRACGVCKAALTADAAPLSGIANMNMPVVLLFALPLAGDDVELKILIAQRGKCPGDKTFCSSIRTIFLAHNGQTMKLHCRYLLAAETTASTGMASR